MEAARQPDGMLTPDGPAARESTLGGVVSQSWTYADLKPCCGPLQPFVGEMMSTLTARDLTREPWRYLGCHPRHSATALPSRAESAREDLFATIAMQVGHPWFGAKSVGITYPCYQSSSSRAATTPE